MKKINLTETITFRVSSETKERFNELAARQNKLTNEWCRDVAVEAADDKHGLTPANQLLLAEIFGLRKFLESIFDSQLNGDLNNETFIDIVTDSTLDRKQSLKKYFQQESFENEELNGISVQFENRTKIIEEVDMSKSNTSYIAQVKHSEPTIKIDEAENKSGQKFGQQMFTFDNTTN